MGATLRLHFTVDCMSIMTDVICDYGLWLCQSHEAPGTCTFKHFMLQYCRSDPEATASKVQPVPIMYTYNIVARIVADLTSTDSPISVHPNMPYSSCSNSLPACSWKVQQAKSQKAPVVKHCSASAYIRDKELAGCMSVRRRKDVNLGTVQEQCGI